MNTPFWSVWKCNFIREARSQGNDNQRNGEWKEETPQRREGAQSRRFFAAKRHRMLEEIDEAAFYAKRRLSFPPSFRVLECCPAQP
jgi:hypothetical protein